MASDTDAYNGIHPSNNEKTKECFLSLLIGGARRANESDYGTLELRLTLNGAPSSLLDPQPHTKVHAFQQGTGLA